MSDPSASVPPDVDEAAAEQKRKYDELYDQLLRLRAEFDNYRKRVEKEKADARLWGKQDVLMPLLALVDVFEQALAQAEHAKDVRQISQGLGFLHKNFESFLRAEGLQPMEVLNKPFDPHWAEVVEQVEGSDDQAGLVLSEVQRGYIFQGRVLRPARVRVGAAPKNTKEDAS